jgi:hypothetical protein
LSACRKKSEQRISIANNNSQQVGRKILFIIFPVIIKQWCAVMPSGTYSALQRRSEAGNKFLKFVLSWLKDTIQGTMRIIDQM